MAIMCVSRMWNDCVDGYIRKFLVDTESDVADLPTCCPGSSAIVAEGGKQYIVNTCGVWVECGSDIATYIDEYMEEALGGDY